MRRSRAFASATRTRSAELFGEVLALCARAGAGRGRHDRRRRHQDRAPTRAARRTAAIEQIAREILDEAAELDAAEDARYRRRAAVMSCRRRWAAGDRVASGCARLKQRARCRARARAETVATRSRRGALRECAAPAREDWRAERRRSPTHDAWLARAGIASDGSRRMTGARHNIKPYPLAAAPAGKINVTDPDSRWSRARAAGFRATTPRPSPPPAQIIVAAEVDHRGHRPPTCEPMVDQPLRRARTPPASIERPRSSSPTPATGTLEPDRPARRRRAPTARRARTPTGARSPARRAAAGL